MFLAAVFFLSTLYDVTIYISTWLSHESIKLTSKQMEMLKVEKTGELLGHVKGMTRVCGAQGTQHYRLSEHENYFCL